MLLCDVVQDLALGLAKKQEYIILSIKVPQPFGHRDALRRQMFRCPQRYNKYRRHILMALRMQKKLTAKDVDAVQRANDIIQ
jgi:hypothetical protein